MSFESPVVPEQSPAEVKKVKKMTLEEGLAEQLAKTEEGSDSIAREAEEKREKGDPGARSEKELEEIRKERRENTIRSYTTAYNLAETMISDFLVENKNNRSKDYGQYVDISRYQDLFLFRDMLEEAVKGLNNYYKQSGDFEQSIGWGNQSGLEHTNNLEIEFESPNDARIVIKTR